MAKTRGSALEHRTCIRDIGFMWMAVRRCLVLLIAFAVIGGQSVQLARASAHGVVAPGMDCCTPMPAHAAVDHSKLMPCKMKAGDCMKQMGCVADVALPVRLAAGGVAPHPSPIAYWSAHARLSGAGRSPDPFPPRTI